MQKRDLIANHGSKTVELEALLRKLEGAERYIGAHDSIELALSQQLAQEFALAAAKISEKRSAPGPNADDCVRLYRVTSAQQLDGGRGWALASWVLVAV